MSEIDGKKMEKRYKQRAKKRAKIKNSLLTELADKGCTGDFYTDLVEDYMNMWDIKEELYIDIKEQGVVTVYQNGSNQFGRKKNDSVKEFSSTNNQMIKLLSALNIKPGDKESQLEKGLSAWGIK